MGRREKIRRRRQKKLQTKRRKCVLRYMVTDVHKVQLSPFLNFPQNNFANRTTKASTITTSEHENKKVSSCTNRCTFQLKGPENSRFWFLMQETTNIRNPHGLCGLDKAGRPQGLAMIKSLAKHMFFCNANTYWTQICPKNRKMFSSLVTGTSPLAWVWCDTASGCVPTRAQAALCRVYSAHRLTGALLT